MEEFFKFYKVTYEAFKSVDESLMLGSPNFSTIYGCDMKSEKLSPLGFNEIDASNFSVVNQNLVPNNIKSIKK